MAYNSNGYLDTITDPLSRIISFQYDVAGRVTQQVMPGGRTVLMGYDANGNVSSITPPGRTEHLFDFTPVDETASYTPPDLGWGSTTTSYAYNRDRQLTTITRPDGQTVVMGYDSAGRVGTITTPTGVTTYSYSPTTGNLDSVTSPGGVTLSYGWDGSLPTSTTWAGPVAGTVIRTYNTDFNVASVTVGGATITNTYDNDRLLTGAGALTITRDATTGFVSGTTLGSVTTVRTYSASFGELATTSASAGSTALYSTTYTRDALGRIAQLDETIEGVSSSTVYEYDGAGRLWKVTHDGTVVAQYGYDLNGNRTSLTSDVGITINGTYDAQDRVTSYGGATYTYTKNGELQSKTVGSDVTSYLYDVLGNLAAVSLPGGRTIEYVVDGDTRRIGNKVNGTLVQGFLWDDQLRIVAELDSVGAVVSRFVYTTGMNVPEYMIKGGVTYRILTDHLGSPRLVVDVAAGTLAQRMDYDEFGRVLNDTNPGFQPFGFAGGLYDKDTKLVRFGARDYDPEIGRWTSKDPALLVGEWNVYAYAANDPVNTQDPGGTKVYIDNSCIPYKDRIQAALDKLERCINDKCKQGLFPPAALQQIQTVLSPTTRYNALCTRTRMGNEIGMGSGFQMFLDKPTLKAGTYGASMWGPGGDVASLIAHEMLHLSPLDYRHDPWWPGTYALGWATELAVEKCR
jgi:RHS repeat-associated protein